MRQAKDLMTPNPKFVQSGEELRDTVNFFLKNEIHYAPVLTPMGEILGLISELGLIKASLRQYLDPERHEKVIHHQDLLEEAAFLEEDCSLDEVVKTMIRSPSHRVLVTNKQQRLVGIISPKDILRFVTGEQKKSGNLRQELDLTRKQAEKLTAELSTLKENLDRFQTLFNETPYMMHSVDAQGKIILANRRIHQSLGYENGELIGKSILDIYPKSVHHEATQGLQKIMKDGFHASTYTTMLTKNGDKIRVDIVSSSLRDKNGQFLGTISISREVDSEHLLRALHGLVSKHIDIPDSLKAELQSTLEPQSAPKKL